MTTVGIVGAGLIGRSWAIVFARAGRPVTIFDSSPDVTGAARAAIRRGLADLAAYGLVDDPEGAERNITFADTLKGAVEAADYVQENLPEDLGIKRAVFAEMDRLAKPDAVLASSTSAIRASLFTEDLPGRHRCLVAHPVNPPHLVPVVELCGTPWTAPETLERARRLHDDVGQSPITVLREMDGFVLNRLQGALLNEAMRLIDEGCVTPEDLDVTVKDGLGLRWAFMGPIETIDLNAPEGVRDYGRRYVPFFERLAAEPAGGSWPAALLDRLDESRRKHVPAEDLPERSAWRDRRLMALLAHKRTAAKDDG